MRSSGVWAALLAPILLAIGVGGGGVALGLLARSGNSRFGFGPALLPPPESDPLLPFPWSARALSPLEVQGMGIDRAVATLVALGLALLIIGASSAALFAWLDGWSRRRERATHGLVGAAPRTLFGGTLRQAIPLAFLGGAVGALIATGTVNHLLRAWPGEVAPGAPDPLLLFGGMGLGVLLLLAGATLPLFRTFRRGWLGDALAPEARTNPGPDGRVVQGVTVTLQLLLTLTLLYPAGLLLRTGSGGEAAHLPAGAGAPSEFVLLPVAADQLSLGDRAEAYRRLVTEAERLPGVAAAGVGSRGALGGRGTLDWVHRPLDGGLLGVPTEHHAVSSGWFDTLGVAVDGGPRDSDAVILNATLARMVGWTDLAREPTTPLRLGRREEVKAGGVLREDLPTVAPGWGRIYRGLPFAFVMSRTPPVAYLPIEAHPPERGELLVRLVPGGAGSPAPAPALEGHLFETAHQAGLVPSPLLTLREHLARLRAPATWLRRLSLALAALTIMLAVFGVGCALHVTAKQRVTEVGIRRAAGAPRLRVAVEMLRELLVPLLVAAWIGLGTAVASGEAITALLALDSAFDPALYLASVALLALAACVGAAGPILQAISVPPAEAIRAGEGYDG